MRQDWRRVGPGGLVTHTLLLRRANGQVVADQTTRTRLLLLLSVCADEFRLVRGVWNTLI